MDLGLFMDLQINFVSQILNDDATQSNTSTYGRSSNLRLLRALLLRLALSFDYFFDS